MARFAFQSRKHYADFATAATERESGHMLSVTRLLGEWAVATGEFGYPRLSEVECIGGTRLATVALQPAGAKL